MKKELVKNKKVIIILIIIALIATTFFVIKLFTNKNKINEVKKESYSFQYDNSWELQKSENEEAKLTHKKSRSELEITVNELENEVQYKSIDEVFDSILYNIQKKNEGYKLIYKEQTKLTSNDIDGYKILFEENDNQVAIYLYKQANKLVVFEFKATSEYFDKLLDSVNSIIYNFKLNEKTFDVKTYIDIETNKIEYTKQENIESQLNEEIEEQIANNNYLVKYTIPSNFKLSSYNSRYGQYNYENTPESTSIKLSVTILERNIYEYLDKKDSNSIFKSYETIRKERDLKEYLDKKSDNPLSYIYKNNYKKEEKDYENIVIINELDQNHICVMEISSTQIGIPEKLVQMLKVKEVKNIASNTDNKKESGLLTGILKKYLNNKQTEEISLKIPEDFKELDDGFANMYTDRSYICNYNEKTTIPEYEVKYSISPAKVDEKIKTLDQSYAKETKDYKGLSQAQEITLNGKKFTVYDTEYNRTKVVSYSDAIKYTYNTKSKILFYELQDNNCLIIEIKANEKEINEDLLNKLTNFDVSVK